MLPNVPVDFLTIPFRKCVQGFLEIVDVFKAFTDFRSTPRIVSNVDRWCEEDMPAMSLISKLAPDRPLPRVTKSYELQFGQLGTSTLELKFFFLPYILLSRYPLSYVYSHRPV